jgi:hypothetical protein
MLGEPVFVACIDRMITDDRFGSAYVSVTASLAHLADSTRGHGVRGVRATSGRCANPFIDLR